MNNCIPTYMKWTNSQEDKLLKLIQEEIDQSFVDGSEQGESSKRPQHTMRLQGGGELPVILKCPTLPLYHMCISVLNLVIAKSSFWYFVSQLMKMKKSSGAIVSCEQVFKKSPLWVKNFGIWLRCNSTAAPQHVPDVPGPDHHGAVTQGYGDMEAQHCTRANSIIKVEEITASKGGQLVVKLFQDSKIKFLPHGVLCCQHQPHFTTKRFNTFFEIHGLFPNLPK